MDAGIKRLGTVQKIIPLVEGVYPERAQIVITDGEALYCEIRIENKLDCEDGSFLTLKEGSPVEILIRGVGSRAPESA